MAAVGRMLEQTRRAGPDVCVIDPAWAFLVTTEVICTPGQLSRAATVQVEPTGTGTDRAVLQSR